MKAIHIKSRKKMTMAGVFHQERYLEYLPLLVHETGTEIINVENCVRMEAKKITKVCDKD